MEASYTTKIVFNGKPDELQRFLNVFDSYKERRYFDWVEMEQSGDESMNITAWGSSGYFTTPNDIDLFRDLAEAAPGASFSASNFGSNDYGVAQKLDGSLNGGILHISAYYEDDEVMGEIYAAYEEMTESSDESDIMSFDDFRFSNDHGFGVIEKMDYDPVSKEYI